MKKTIALTLTILMIGSVYASQAQKEIKLTTDLKDIIERELDTSKTDSDIVTVNENTNINDTGRTEGKS